MVRSGLQLSRVVARASGVSRRVAHEAVLTGRVKIDGVECRQSHQRVPVDGAAVVSLDGSNLRLPLTEIARLWRYNKPRGLITSHADPRGRPTVFDNLPAALPNGIISVGRLDVNSEGLLLLTTCGALARDLMHPSSGVVRKYRACVSVGARDVTPSMIDQLARGLTLADGFTFRPIHASLEENHGHGSSSSSSSSSGTRWVRMELTEGKNREVRRAWEHFGFATARLIRTHYGPLELGEELQPGDVCEVDENEVSRIRRDLRTAASRAASSSMDVREMT